MPTMSIFPGPDSYLARPTHRRPASSASGADPRLLQEYGSISGYIDSSGQPFKTPTNRCVDTAWTPAPVGLSPIKMALQLSIQRGNMLPSDQAYFAPAYSSDIWTPSPPNVDVPYDTFTYPPYPSLSAPGNYYPSVANGHDCGELDTDVAALAAQYLDFTPHDQAGTAGRPSLLIGGMSASSSHSPNSMPHNVYHHARVQQTEQLIDARTLPTPTFVRPPSAGSSSNLSSHPPRSDSSTPVSDFSRSPSQHLPQLPDIDRSSYPELVTNISQASRSMPRSRVSHRPSPKSRSRTADSQLPTWTRPHTFRITTAKKAGEPKKPSLACLFCRQRKIACGRPAVGSKDHTCDQCTRRKIECVFPTESRRGHHARLKAASHVNTEQ